jgi:hypothetical protein
LLSPFSVFQTYNSNTIQKLKSLFVQVEVENGYDAARDCVMCVYFTRRLPLGTRTTRDIFGKRKKIINLQNGKTTVHHITRNDTTICAIISDSVPTFDRSALHTFLFLHYHYSFGLLLLRLLLTMKVYSVSLLLASITSTTTAFSAVAPSTAGAAATGNPDPVDRSMRGIDQPDSFDPTGGDSPALIRNNNDQVWVPQVRST